MNSPILIGFQNTATTVVCDIDCEIYVKADNIMLGLVDACVQNYCDKPLDIEFIKLKCLVVWLPTCLSIVVRLEAKQSST